MNWMFSLVLSFLGILLFVLLISSDATSQQSSLFRNFSLSDETSSSDTFRWFRSKNISTVSFSVSSRNLATKAGTTSRIYPPGPYIRPSKANEVVKLPDPPAPVIRPRTKCPHRTSSSLRDWHVPSTWNRRRIPRQGENVILPINTKVVVRRSVREILGIVTIPPSSELIFAENSTHGITLDAHGIDVQGALTMGSDTCRLEASVTITLHGERPVDVVTNVPDPVVKGISVTGRINIHGKRFYRTWTRLSRTVNAGDTVLMLQHRVNWSVGQQIILVTTAMKDSREWHQNEIAIVKNIVTNPVAGVATAVFLKDPVQYRHLAIANYQGEVGLLSRTITIQGSEISEPDDKDSLDCTSAQSFYGDNSIPCPNTQLNGYGGHIIVHKGGKGYVQGVELFRMGQTNVIGRYPMHFHVLGDNCRDCYFRDSSIHRSFYRCVSIHGTNYLKIIENVAFDVTGYCYYFEDGVEHHNRLEFNLGAHIHMIGPEPPWGEGQTTQTYQQSSTLTLPADVTASAFYITNIQNYIIGNAASGGWAGFAFPNLREPLGIHRGVVNIRPSSVTALTIDGNIAHSTAWWWYHAAAFYWGGSLYYNDENMLEYNAGRDQNNERVNCNVNKCETEGNCDEYCSPDEQNWITITNTKAFLVSGVGFGSWSGRMEVIGFECHDCGLSLESLSDGGFWIHEMLNVCRTKTAIALPANARATNIPGSGFQWYDTDQKHIITLAEFRNCGYRSNQYNQYDKGSSRGCGNEDTIGCHFDSSVWGMLTHSDQFTPEQMQGTRAITFRNCGRRFRLVGGPNSVSGRAQNWYDADGSITGFGETSMAASGLSEAGLWWRIDEEVVYEPQAPLWFFKLRNGPQRGIGHFHMEWDESLHNQVGVSQCGNGDGFPCDYVGYIQHLGSYFESDSGLPITANADVVGPVGGFGWKLELFEGAPKSIRFSLIEVAPETPLLLSIAYPPGTSFTIIAHAGWCSDDVNFSCTEKFHQVGSIEEVRNSIGNTYNVDSDGVLTLRIIQTPKLFVGRPDFFLPEWSDTGRYQENFALERFERDGVRLIRMTYGPFLTIDADCESSGFYCIERPNSYFPDVCPPGFRQIAYDTCISQSGSKKLFADGTIVE